MNEIIIKLASIYLLGFGVYHVITGIVSYFFTNFSFKFYKTLYGFEPIETEQFKLSLRPWGSLALVVGLISLIVSSNISQYKLLLIPLAFLLLLRILYRFWFRQTLEINYKISTSRNLVMIFIQLIGIVLMYYLYLS